jgi:cell division transport system ATP-binding protein
MLISYKNADICHSDNEKVLHSVNFHVDEGEFIYLIGRVGSGKSSLLKTIYCEIDIEKADEANVLGQDLLTIRRKEVPELRRQMGIIFQDFQLLSDRNVYRNLCFVLNATGWKEKEHINERIDEVLEQVGMKGMKERMPHELSGGEQQRIAIARALLNHPKLIVADEPTASLDNETAEKIILLLREISLRGTAVILTTHNRSLLNKYPGIVYRCNDKELEEVTDDYNQLQLSEEELNDQN